MPENQIVRIETVDLERGNEPITGIKIAVDCYDLSGAESLVSEVVDKFLVHRMCSPPETSLLLITLMGALKPEEFASFWKKHLEQNEALGFFMSQMEKADVAGMSENQELLQASLLPTPESAARSS